jgi:hypothetical protein
MFTVELYAKIRRAVMVDGLSRGEAAKRFGVHRNTITTMLSFSVPPGYRRRERPVSKKLGPHMAWIDAILEEDSKVHKKQRHTARRIFERRRGEQGFASGRARTHDPLARESAVHRASIRDDFSARSFRAAVCQSPGTWFLRGAHRNAVLQW